MDFCPRGCPLEAHRITKGSLTKVRIGVSFRTRKALECSAWGRESPKSQEAALGLGSKYDLGVMVVSSLSLEVKSEHTCGGPERSQILKKGDNKMTVEVPSGLRV